MREIFKVEAIQVITSENHPEGVLSNLPEFPKTIDSRNYNATAENPNGDPGTALIVARARFADEVETLTVANNPNRAMWAVTLTRADGRQIMRETRGAFPDMTPAPEPEPEPNEEEVDAE